VEPGQRWFWFGTHSAILFATRICIGIGEGGYGPAAPTILSDLSRSKDAVASWRFFTTAIPVGSALGYVIGALIGAHLGWRWHLSRHAAGFALGLLCFLAARSARRRTSLVQEAPRRRLADYLRLFRTRSYLINCIAQTLMTFVTGAWGFGTSLLRYRNQSPDVGVTILD